MRFIRLWRAYLYFYRKIFQIYICLVFKQFEKILEIYSKKVLEMFGAYMKKTLSLHHFRLKNGRNDKTKEFIERLKK